MRLDHGKIEVFGQQQANITAMADHKRHLSKSGLANDAISRNIRSHQAGHPVDVGLIGVASDVDLSSMREGDERLPKEFNNVSDYFSQLACTASDELGWTGLRLISASEVSDDVMFSTGKESITLELTGTASHLSVLDGLVSERATDPGDICLVPAGIEARFSWVVSAPSQHSVMVEFDRTLFAQYCPEIATESFLAGHLEPRDYAPNPHIAFLIGLLARELDSTLRRGRLFSETAIRLLAMEIAASAWTRKHALLGLEPGFDSRVRVAIDFIESNYLRDLSLVDLGYACSLGITRLVHLFKLETGHTPYAYVVRRRLRHAVQLLRTTKMPIAHVAIESGFSDQQHMTRLFKQHLGQTPKSFRNGG